MAGLFCIVTPGERKGGAEFSRRLAESMILFPWQRARTLEVDPGKVWIGAAANGIEEADLARVCCPAGPISAVVEGCILRSRSECGAEGLIAKGLYAQAAIAAFAHNRACFPASLEGQFNVILHDAERGAVVVANSRHEHSPLYYWQDSEAFGAATSLGPLGACGLFAPVVDTRAVTTFLTYGQFFDDQSMLSGVKVLGQAAVMELSVTGLGRRFSTYWDMGRITPAPATLPFREHVGQLVDTLDAAARLATRRPGRYVAGLSGGLDSRLNLAAVRRHVGDLRAWTFGEAGASDVDTAATICRCLGISHLVYAIEPRAIPRNVIDFVTTVDASTTAGFAYQLDRARDLRCHADIVLNGYAGEVIVRGVMLDLKEADWARWARSRLGLGPRAPHPMFEKNRSHVDVLRFLESKYGRCSGLVGLLNHEPPAFVEVAHDSLARLKTAVPAHLLAEAWITENRGRRWTMMGIVSDRHFYADGSVFYDYDFQDRCFATPSKHRRHGRLYLPLLSAFEPRLAAIRSGNTGLPLAASRVHHVASRLRARVTAPGAGRVVSTGARPASWLRGVLREACSRMLDASSTRERPWWDANAVRAQWEAHLAGAVDFTVELGLIASVELFARRWVDSTRGSGARAAAPML